MDRVRFALLVPFMLVLVACESHPQTGAFAQSGRAVDEAGEGGAGGFAGAGAWGGVAGGDADLEGSDGYRVAIFAPATVLCPGECTELTARAMNGHGPYAYAWSEQLGEGAGLHRVCPESTTTYTVTARDTAIEGDEFERPSRLAEATIGIVVDDTDTRGCGAIDADPPAEPGTTAELCSLAIGYESSGSATPLILLESGTTLATDAEGNLYFAGTFQGVIDLGVGPSAHQATDSGFVAKYDASCTPVWTTILGDVESESQVELRALDVAPDGTVVVGGKVGGPIDLNGHALSPSRPSVLVMSLDGADGTVSWVASYESPHNDSMIYQLAVDGAGEIVLGGQAGGDLVIDGVTIEGPEDGLMDFMAKVSASGHYRFGYELKGADASRFAVRDDGKIALTSWAWGDVQLGPADEALFESTFTHRFVALLDADGLSEWGRLLDPDLSWGDTTWSPGTVAFDSEGNVLVEHGNLGTAASLGDHEPAELLSKYDEGGQLLWSRAISPRTWRSNQAPEGGIATDSRGNIVQTLELPDYGQAMPAGYSALPDDVFVQKLRGDGSVVWQHRFATDVYENAFGVTVAPDDSIWVGHGVDPSYQPGTGTLRITKLAP